VELDRGPSWSSTAARRGARAATPGALALRHPPCGRAGDRPRR